MRAKDFLPEATLDPGSLFEPKYLEWRPANFLKKLKDRSPFIDKAGNEYIPNEGEYNRLRTAVEKAVNDRLKNPKAPVPSLTINTDRGEIAVSKLEKADLQSIKGQVTQNVNVQPIGIGIASTPANKPGTKPKDKQVLSIDQQIQKALDANQSIVAKDLFKIIYKNKALEQAGALGKAIKKAAYEISNGIIPNLNEYDKKTQSLIAIDAGEYLGILGMIHNIADFPKKEQFLKFLNAPNLDGLSLIFPGDQNASLSDSYGVQNATTGQTILISSKGGIGKTATGAAPAISGLTIPEKMLKKIKPGSAIDFISMIQKTKVANQPFAAMNFLHYYYPKTIPKLYQNLLPFTYDDFDSISNSISTGAKLPAKFNKILTSRVITTRATPGGILAYCVIKDFVDTVNQVQPMKDLRTVILEILDENFVQIFTRIVGGNLTFKVLWPGKIDGAVSLHTKAEAANPSAAGLSFKVTD
jgi:hypothetical protein